MPWCPNPDCPHRRLVGRAAEYVAGSESCAECGTHLVATAAEAGLTAGALRSSRRPLPAPLRRRLLVTAGVAAGLWLMTRVPLPLIDTDAFWGSLGFWVGDATILSLGTQGVTPLLVGFVLVELVALAIPRLRARRHGDPTLRRKLNRAALGLGLILAAAGGLSLAVVLESWGWDFAQTPVVGSPGWGFRLVTMAAVTAGTSMYAVAAALLERYGLGSGFAVVLLIGQGLNLPSGLSLWSTVAASTTPWSMLMATGVFAAMVWLALALLTRADRHPVGLPVRLPTCGAFPLEVAILIQLVPFWLAPYVAAGWIERWAAALYPGSDLALGLELGLTVALLPVMSRLFYRRHIERLADQREWRAAQVRSGAMLVAMVLVPVALRALVGGAAALMPTPLSVLVVTALVADLVVEVRGRWRAPDGVDLVVGSVHHDVADAVDAAQADGSPVIVVQGLYYRSLTYVFGPFVPMRILTAPPAGDSAPR